MTSDPGVTVVIPTHNRPELMRRALMSVLNQDYVAPIQVIIVFDACQPFHPDVPEYENRTIKTTTNQRSRGLAGARNTGIDQAENPFVAFLDDDDMWHPTKLRVQMEVFASHPDSALVGTGILVDAGDRRHLRKVDREQVSHRDLLHDRLPGLHSSTFVFQRELLRSAIGMVDEDLPGSYGEDYDLLLRTAKVGPIRVVDIPLTRVTWQGQSYFFGKWDQYAAALTWMLEQHPEFAAHHKAVGRLHGQIAFAHVAAGDRQQGRRWARTALRHDPTQIKAALALTIGLRLMSAKLVIRTAQRFGRGI